MLSLDAFDLFPLMKLTKQIRKLADAKTTSEFFEVSINFHFGKQTPAKNFTKKYYSWNLENINLTCLLLLFESLSHRKSSYHSSVALVNLRCF